jgi:hypothetical protein
MNRSRSRDDDLTLIECQIGEMESALLIGAAY